MTLESFFENFGGNLSEASLVSFGIAFLAGIVSSGVCPCTLPVGLGMAGLVSTNSEKRSSYGFFIAGAFFVGIVLSLTMLGALAGRIGVILTETFGRYWALAMVVISIIAAIAAFSGPGIRVAKLAAMRKPGIGGAILYGFIFSLGTSAAPLLLLLSVAAATADPLYGLSLAFSFGLGRGAPFLLVGLFAGAVSRLAQLTWLRRSIQIASGSALLFVAFYYGWVLIELMR